MYNQEAMIPPKHVDIWISKVLVTIGKETHHAIFDLGSSVSVLSKELYEVLELKNLEKCSIELALADDSLREATRLFLFLIFFVSSYCNKRLSL